MSEGSVARNALSFILEHSFESETRQALRAALDAARPGPLQTFWELAADAGHSPEQVRKLCTGLFLLFAWGNLTDDLVDGDCNYLEEPGRSGPIVTFLLRCLADEYLLRVAAMPGAVMAHSYRLLAGGAAMGIKEVKTKQWQAERWLEVGRGIAGMQYQAYLSILWHGTAMASIAEEVGQKLGMIAHLYHDICSEDPRFFSMSPEEQSASEKWVQQQVESLTAIANQYGISSLLTLLSHLNWRNQHVHRD